MVTLKRVTLYSGITPSSYNSAALYAYTVTVRSFTAAMRHSYSTLFRSDTGRKRTSRQRHHSTESAMAGAGSLYAYTSIK
jgi:hypothetical protein